MSRNIRDISPFLQKIRNFLLGRSHTLAVRFQDNLATRSPPLPDLPDGPSHRLSANYYCGRDARREVIPPEQVFPAAKMIESGETSPPSKPVKSRTPGKLFLWD
ncbi:CI-B14 5a domain containing protein [Asbolus verrucosus]|uniref:NADH dehydrogenase [ubiquinone] 1 alpha subcomplex subunit 7 n=1 Tax=Asbolus verrucosus TaxID=1661398 RepID=A0A482VWU6_ASBVE|nr:CI-B14 5a domain containing protein [Asbolus verrucosus]